jgi:hypothetical protein
MQKKIFLIVIVVLQTFFFMKNGYSQLSSDKKLDWLNKNIVQKKNLFIEKPFSILLDSLKDLKNEIYEYSGAVDSSLTLLSNDTIFVNYFELYFEPFLGSEKVNNHSKVFFSNKFNDTLKTDIVRIKIFLKYPIPFLRIWHSVDRKGLGSFLWNRKIRNFFHNSILKDVEVDLY